jgi:hypothetical protein
MRRRGARGPARKTARRAGRQHRRRRRRRLVLAGGAVVWAGHKLSKKDAEQIEEHTGKPPDDLADEEVEAAMNELGIEEQELTEEDKAAIEAAEDED